MFKDYDFIYIDYTGIVKDTGEVFDTTIEEVAKKANIAEEGKSFEPLLVILGEHAVVKGLEEELYKMSVGEEKEIEVLPEKAYGDRDPNKTRIVPISRFSRPSSIKPNTRVRLEDGTIATVRSVSGGRVFLDLNHPLAGKTLVFKVKVISKLENEKDKILAILRRRFGKNITEKFVIELSEDLKKVRLQVPNEISLGQDVQFLQYFAARDILLFVLPEASVSFVYEFTKNSIST
jgi:peptidylprolyl isomerase